MFLRDLRSNKVYIWQDCPRDTFGNLILCHPFVPLRQASVGFFVFYFFFSNIRRWLMITERFPCVFCLKS